MTKPTAEVAALFDAQEASAGNAGEEVYPGYPGLVVAKGRVGTMAWGFPLALKGKDGQRLKPKPVNNTRADKLDSGFWRPSFQARRCLIPVTEFAEAQGPKGAKTRTWISVPEEPVFAVAGIWRPTDEWGPAYSMIMTDACVQLEGVHDRMPVILGKDDWTRWTDAPPEEARSLCRPYAGELTVKRTSEPWVRR